MMQRIMTVNQAYKQLGLCLEDRRHDMLGCMLELDKFCEKNGYTVVDGILWKDVDDEA